ncbi:MAG: alkaline phosphatase family protein [Verrucomicrobia bacterium]|nr:alkaline phosphatase family protein [Verrucomicrobiota bacterium]
MSKLLNSAVRCLLGFTCVSAVTLATHAGAPFPNLKTRNVILVTTDGLRWQEVFGGVEAALLNKEHGGVVKTNELRAAFLRDTPEARRAALLPFLWRVVAQQGQLLGNTNEGSVVRLSNDLKFSYPSYNEMLSGAPDPRIDRNDYGPNPNVTVLEWLNQKPRWRGRVAAFCSWDVLAQTLNRKRSGLHVRAGWEPMTLGKLDARQALLNQLIRDTSPVFDDVVYDSFVFAAAMDYLKSRKPRVLYVMFGETDDWAHEGRYDRAMQAAHRFDDYVRRLWETVQAMPQYRNKTTLLLTTDHGRGSGLTEWKDHGRKTDGAAYIWLAALGPDTQALGERANTEPLTQGQVAATLAAFLGEDYCAAFPKAGRPVSDFFRR